MATSMNAKGNADDKKPGLQAESEPYMKLYDDYLWLKNQCQEVQAAIDYEKSKDPDSSEEASSVFEKIDSILHQVQDQVLANMITNTAIPRLQLADVLYQATFSNMGLEDVEEEVEGLVSESLQEEIQQLLKTDSKLSSECLALDKELKTLSSEVLGLQQELSRRTSERAFMTMEIQEKREREKQQEERAKTEKIKKMEEKARKTSKLIMINNLVMQLLIGYSGVNWTEDPELLNLVIECGRPLDEQLQNVM